MEPRNSNQSNTISIGKGSITMVGAVMILSGLVVLLDRRLQTGWLSSLVVPVIGLSWILAGMRARQMRLLIPGSLVTGAGLGVFFSFGVPLQFDWLGRVGILLFSFGIGWFAIALLTYLLYRHITWWAVLTGSVIGAVGLAFLNGPLSVILFAFFIGTGLGLAFLAWGVAEHLFGLIIPGCLLISIGPGLYLAWSESSEPNSLARTGIMLVSFALGWGLITVFSRVITSKFVWWPLIPGGILAMVGWGLYIGGNPDNALSFIGNTGSIGLIFFGIYLLLLRRGIHN
ncbi:MAG TPA: hypothetical protein VHP14_14710 [Anaerolineales bacterium]|nr:hypothetical protein [Anaerolineales bacterium]